MLKILLAILSLSITAEASLQVHPTRVIFEGGKRVAQITIEHRGEKPETYRISTMFYEMAEDGSMHGKLLPTKEDRSAHKYIRFSPKKVTLEPFKEQVVRIMLRNPSAIPKSDFRTHLYFRPSDKVETTEKKSDKNKAQMSLKAKVAVAIPVIIKNKQKYDYKNNLKLQNLKVVKGKNNRLEFHVQILNNSEDFIHANFRLNYLKDGKTYLISRVNGVSVYTKKRTAHYPIELPKDLKLESGDLELKLKLPNSEGGEVIASTTTKL